MHVPSNKTGLSELILVTFVVLKHGDCSNRCLCKNGTVGLPYSGDFNYFYVKFAKLIVLRLCPLLHLCNTVIFTGVAQGHTANRTSLQYF